MQWSPPSLDEQNGVIIGYNFSLHDSSNDLLVTTVTYTNNSTVSFLEPYTTYQWRVAAFTSVGLGPYSSWSFFQTQEAG